MKSETRLVNRIVKRLKYLRDREHMPIWFVKIHGSVFGRNGIPDLLLCVGGIFVGLEVKMPEQKPRPRQLVELERIGKAGGVPLSVCSPEEAEQIVRLLTYKALTEEK